MKRKQIAGMASTLAVTGVTLAAGVSSVATGQPPAREAQKGKAWTLPTDDTELTLVMASNTLRVVRLRNPAQNWNWTPTPSPVPMPSVQGKTSNWEFREATEIKTNATSGRTSGDRDFLRGFCWTGEWV